MVSRYSQPLQLCNMAVPKIYFDHFILECSKCKILGMYVLKLFIQLIVYKRIIFVQVYREVQNHHFVSSQKNEMGALALRPLFLPYAVAEFKKHYQVIRYRVRREKLYTATK